MPTVCELRIAAKAKGLRGYSKMNKARLTELLAPEKPKPTPLSASGSARRVKAKDTAKGVAAARNKLSPLELFGQLPALARLNILKAGTTGVKVGNPAEISIEKARDFVFNFKPKRITEKYKREFNRNAIILKKPIEKEEDEIYEKLKKQILGRGNMYRDDARQTFDDIVRRATPYNEAQTIWNINRERVDVPLFKRYRELEEKMSALSEY